MRAAVLHGKGDLRVAEVPVPRPGDGEVLLRVRAVGLCGTDAAEYAHGPMMMPVATRHPVTGHHGPMVIGHEFAGEVVEVGPGVDRAWTGRLLASCGVIFCGDCGACRAGRTNHCRTYAAVGLHRDGAAAEFVAAPLSSCEPADSRALPPDAAALGQPMSIAVHATQRARLAGGERVVMFGAGGIGAFLAYVLARRGAQLLVVDPDESRRHLAAALGAAALARPGDDLAPADLLGGEPEVVFECSGTEAGLAAALSVLPAGARLVVVGMQKRPVAIDLRRATIRENEIIGTNGMARTPDFSDALDLVAARTQGWADVAPLALPLDEIATGALAPMAAGAAPAVKVLVDPAATRRRPSQTVPATVATQEG